MPEFGTAFSTRNFDHKLTRDELVRGLRLSIAAEYEAVQIYAQIAEAIDDEYAKAVINDVIEEERVHAGQFLDLLKKIQTDEEKYYQKGAAENKEIEKRIKK